MFTADWRCVDGDRRGTRPRARRSFLDEARAAGALGLLPYALYVSVQLLLRDGEWARAYAEAAEGARIAADVANVLRRHQLLAIWR